jgi:peptidyl-prolyl cis-trans isomerase SurA
MLSPLCRWLAAALTAALLLAAAQPARAQVVALVNGVPITEIDIAQRTKLIQVSRNKSPSRKEVLQELIDDQLKIFTTKRYGIEASDTDVDNAFANMAQRSRMSPQQFAQFMSARGMSAATLKLKIRADLGWNNLVRGKFASTLQVNDVDIRNALQTQSDASKTNEGHVYTLYPITLVAAGGGAQDARRREAENLRERFQSCADGLKLARALRGVVVREPVQRSSADLAPQLRDVLDKMDVGRLTSPEATEQGLQMFALCERKDTNDTPAKRAAREALFLKRFEKESKKYLEEVRRQSMIEYR